MRIITLLTIGLFFFPSITYAEGGFVIAQDTGTPDIELPTVPDLPLPPMPGSVEDATKKESPLPLPPIPNPVEDATKKEAPPPLPPIPLLPSKDTTSKEAEPSVPPPPTIPVPADNEKTAPTTKKGTEEQEVIKEGEALEVKAPVPSSSEEKMAEKMPKEKTDRCDPLPKSLEKCEPFQCEYKGFDSDEPAFVKQWMVKGKDGRNCSYSESMPRKTSLKCNFSSSSRMAYATYLRALLVDRKPLTDQDTATAYLKAKSDECQIVAEGGTALDSKLYNIIKSLPENVDDYGASDTPKGDCETLNEKLKSCELFYCKGNDPIQEQFFNRKQEVERKIIGSIQDSCIYVQKTAGKDLVGCKYIKTDGTTTSQCSVDTLAEIAKDGTFFNKLTLAEKAASEEPTLEEPTIKIKKKKRKKEDGTALADLDYNTQVLSSIIYKKQYDKENKDLPVAHYPNEFKQMAFAALDRNDMEALRAFITKIRELDNQLKRDNKRPLGGTEIRDDNGNTLLIRSVLGNNFVAARMLVGEGSDLNAQNNSGVTALQAAAYSGRENMVRLLVGMGANRDIADKYGRTALTHSIEKHYNTITQLLLSGKSSDENGESDTSAVDPARGADALFVAAKLGSSGAVSSLLDSKVDINARDGNRKTALMYAAEAGRAAVVDILIRRGANIFLQDNAGRTAEVLAATAGHSAVAQRLASAAIDKRLHR